jgi:glycerate-2-kinase
MLTVKAHQIWLSALCAVDVATILRQRIRLENGILWIDNKDYVLTNYDEILLIGMGKASLEMGEVMETMIHHPNMQGLLVTNRRSYRSVKSEVIVAGHPVPNQQSEFAARKIIQLLENSKTNSLVVFLISGGGSSMVELPVESVSLRELQETNRVLVTCGADIQEINIIRKVLSQIKGGKLKRYLKGEACAIYLSDVKTGDLKSLASGPLIDEKITPETVYNIMEKYHLDTRLPATVKDYLSALPAEVRENGVEAQKNIIHFLLMDNLKIVSVAAEFARAQGMQVEFHSNQIDGHDKEVADLLLQQLLRLQQQYPEKIVALISGGEVTCPVKGNGIGGRNMEFTLYAVQQATSLIKDAEVVILSSGSDGIDGISSAAGAIFSTNDYQRAVVNGLNASDFLSHNDSHSFFQQTGGLLCCGATGNNIRDLRILIAETTKSG